MAYSSSMTNGTRFKTVHGEDVTITVQNGSTYSKLPRWDWVRGRAYADNIDFKSTAHESSRKTCSSGTVSYKS